MCFIQKLENLNQSLRKENRSNECLTIRYAMLDRNGTAENIFFLAAHGVLLMSSEFYSALLMHYCLEEPYSPEVNTVT